MGGGGKDESAGWDDGTKPYHEGQTIAASEEDKHPTATAQGNDNAKDIVIDRKNLLTLSGMAMPKWRRC